MVCPLLFFRLFSGGWGGGQLGFLTLVEATRETPGGEEEEEGGHAPPVKKCFQNECHIVITCCSAMAANSPQLQRWLLRMRRKSLLTFAR